MAQKNFATAPKPAKTPTTQEIAAFERGGTGHDKRLGKPKAAQKVKTEPEPTKRLSLDLPQSLHTRFKTACSATNRKMVSELQTFIMARTAELEDEAKITHK